MAYPGQLHNTNHQPVYQSTAPLPRAFSAEDPGFPSAHPPALRSAATAPYPSSPPVAPHLSPHQTTSRGVGSYFSVAPQPQQSYVPQSLPQSVPLHQYVPQRSSPQPQYVPQQQYLPQQQYVPQNQYQTAQPRPGPKRKALLIGINYFGMKQELKGCINDVHNIKQFIQQNYGFTMADTVILTDDQQDPVCRPTRANIIRGMKWLVHDAKPGDSFFLHYSGHGAQTEDLDGDEEDGLDETILPLDFKSAGHIVDDEIHDIVVKPLPKGARLTAIFDCCHSGSVLDLPYEYSITGVKKETSLVRETAKGLFNAGVAYARGDMDAIAGVGIQLFNRVTKGKDAKEKSLREKSTLADVVQFSGCKDYETAADTVAAGQATGAMSWAFRQVLTKQPNQTYQSLLQNVRDILSEPPFHQKPVLSAGHPLNTKERFVM